MVAGDKKMHHIILLTLSGLALIVGQGSLPPLPLTLNPTLVIVVYAGQFYLPITGLIMSFLLGYFLDLASGGLLGLNSFSMVSLCYLSYLLGSRIVIQNRLSQSLVVFSFYLLYGGIVYSLFRFFNIDVTGYSYLKVILRDGAATAILSPVIISAIRKMERFLRFQNERTTTPGNIKI